MDKAIWAKIDSVLSKVGAFVTGTKVGDRYALDTTTQSIGFTNSTISLLGAAQSSGLLTGETYDQIIYEEINGDGILSFSLSGVSQFLVRVKVTGLDSWQVLKESPSGFMQQEDGFNVLQETGDALLVEGLIPA